MLGIKKKLKQKQCSYIKWLNEEEGMHECPHTALSKEDGESLCIFHLKEKEDVVFWEAFGVFAEEHKTKQPEKAFQCIGFHFPTVYPDQIKPLLEELEKLDWRQSEFHNTFILIEAEFIEINFSDCIFHDHASFQKITIEGEAKFHSAHFLNTNNPINDLATHFTLVQFRGKTDFSFSRFGGMSAFSECQFYELVDYSNSRFENLTFESVEFKGHANFLEISMAQILIFNKIKFSFLYLRRKINQYLDQPIIFYEAVALNPKEGLLLCIPPTARSIEFNHCDMSRISLQGANLDTITLIENQWSYKTNKLYQTVVDVSILAYFYLETKELLQNPDSQTTEQQKQIFTSLQKFSPSCQKPRVLLEDNHPDKHSDKFYEFITIKQLEVTSEIVKNQIRQLYLGLQLKYEEQHDYKLAGEFHYQAISIRQNILSDNKWKTFPQDMEYLFLKLYHLTAHYGENFRRIGFCMVGSLFATAGILTYIQNKTLTYWQKLGQLVQALIPKTVVNLGGNSAEEIFNPLEKAVVATEAIFFLTMLVLFIMAVRRQFKR